MSEPHQVGINLAARLTGKNKATISRDTKSGKLSATVREDGSKSYQVVELERVYGKLRNPDTSDEPGVNHRNEPADITSVTSVFPEVVKAKDEVIDILKQQVEDLKRDRDNWREQALRILPAPVKEPPAPPQKTPWWSFTRKAKA
ncbi:MAG: hypothetical protein ACREP9_05220 [Candidatus Dormibacteraceae bacterium]